MLRRAGNHRVRKQFVLILGGGGITGVSVIIESDGARNLEVIHGCIFHV